jgi:hypothetical protein
VPRLAVSHYRLVLPTDQHYKEYYKPKTTELGSHAIENCSKHYQPHQNPCQNFNHNIIYKEANLTMANKRISALLTPDANGLTSPKNKQRLNDLQEIKGKLNMDSKPPPEPPDTRMNSSLYNIITNLKKHCKKTFDTQPQFNPTLIRTSTITDQDKQGTSDDSSQEDEEEDEEQEHDEQEEDNKIQEEQDNQDNEAKDEQKKGEYESQNLQDVNGNGDHAVENVEKEDEYESNMPHQPPHIDKTSCLHKTNIKQNYCRNILSSMNTLTNYTLDYNALVQCRHISNIPLTKINNITGQNLQLEHLHEIMLSFLRLPIGDHIAQINFLHNTEDQHLNKLLLLYPQDILNQLRDLQVVPVLEYLQRIDDEETRRTQQETDQQYEQDKKQREKQEKWEKKERAKEARKAKEKKKKEKRTELDQEEIGEIELEKKAEEIRKIYLANMESERVAREKQRSDQDDKRQKEIADHLADSIARTKSKMDALDKKKIDHATNQQNKEEIREREMR